MKELTLSQRNLWLVPTSGGVWLLFFWFLILFGSINYQNNLGFMMVFTIAVVGFLSILMSFRNLQHRQFQVTSQQWIFAQHPSKITIYSTSPRTSYRLSMSCSSNEQTRNETLPSVGNDTLYLNCRFPSRGVHPIPQIEIGSLFPFGWLYTRTRWRSDTNITVFPQPIPGPLQLWSGAEQLTGDEHDLHYPREYQPGDPLKQILWKKARPNQPLTVMTRSDGNALDVLAYESYSNVPHERRLSHLCAAILDKQHAQERFALALPHITLGPDQGNEFCHSCLTALAEMP